jgi:hypothetical protein
LFLNQPGRRPNRKKLRVVGHSVQHPHCERLLLFELLAARQLLSLLDGFGCFCHDAFSLLGRDPETQPDDLTLELSEEPLRLQRSLLFKFLGACSALYRHSAIATPNRNQGPKLEDAQSKALSSGDSSWNRVHGLAVLNFSPPRLKSQHMGPSPTPIQRTLMVPRHLGDPQWQRTLSPFFAK